MSREFTMVGDEYEHQMPGQTRSRIMAKTPRTPQSSIGPYGPASGRTRPLTRGGTPRTSPTPTQKLKRMESELARSQAENGNLQLRLATAGIQQEHVQDKVKAMKSDHVIVTGQAHTQRDNAKLQSLEVQEWANTALLKERADADRAQDEADKAIAELHNNRLVMDSRMSHANRTLQEMEEARAAAERMSSRWAIEAERCWTERGVANEQMQAIMVEADRRIILAEKAAKDIASELVSSKALMDDAGSRELMRVETMKEAERMYTALAETTRSLEDQIRDESGYVVRLKAAGNEQAKDLAKKLKTLHYECDTAISKWQKGCDKEGTAIHYSEFDIDESHLVRWEDSVRRNTIDE